MELDHGHKSGHVWGPCWWRIPNLGILTRKKHSQERAGFSGALTGWFLFPRGRLTSTSFFYLWRSSYPYAPIVSWWSSCPMATACLHGFRAGALALWRSSHPMAIVCPHGNAWTSERRVCSISGCYYGRHTLISGEN